MDVGVYSGADQVELSGNGSRLPAWHPVLRRLQTQTDGRGIGALLPHLPVILEAPPPQGKGG